MKKLITLFLLFTSLSYGANECIVCHKGIEDIRDRDSGMMKEILKIAQKAGHEGNDCIVCHGGDPKSKSVKYAHNGTIEYFKQNKGPKNYYPAPASTWVNENTCGMCHENQVGAQMNSLMMTEQGKIQGSMWSFGGKEGYEHTVGTYDTKNPSDPDKRLGTDVYKKYMTKLATMEPQGFPKEMHELPNAPTVEEVHKDPSLAVYTYLKQELLKSSKKNNLRADGCASCHIPYSKEGYYEGNDKKISKKSGHILTHQIQSSRKVKVHVNEINYSGVPVGTCLTCHDSGKRIGASYQGLIESESNPHTKKYIHMQADVHFQKGMLCQDCHTSNDLHGDGFLSGASAGAVEIECQDCHGTTKKYPWELPIGYSDEFNTTEATGEERGVAQDLAKYLKQGYVPEKEDGYILTARGNPLPKAVKKGNKIIMHLASGKDIELKPLKLLKDTKALSAAGLLSMDTIETHSSRLECYACHATWAPQHYGGEVKVDYAKGDAQITKTSGYLRWEEPALSQNGEGRVSPTVPGCQTTITVIGKDGKALLQNHIFKIPNVEGAGEEGQNAIDMAPIQPHTIQKQARTCESCHASPKALGLGIGGGKLNADPSKTSIIDLMSADGKILPKRTDEQISAIPNLKYDYSQFIDENGTQLMTVGHHWTLSGPLSKEQRDKLDRSGVCLSCHIDIPEGNLAVSAMTHITNMTDYNIDAKEHGSIMNKLLNIGAWLQLSIVVLFALLLIFVVYIIFFKKQPNNPRNEGWK